METVTTPSFSSSNTLDEFDMSLFHKVNSHVRYERFDELLKLIVIDGERRKPVNLMNDPVLSVVISANKTKLAVKLIEKVESVRLLLDENIYGDTALHIAAVKGNFNVAWALLQREAQLMEAIMAIERNDTVAETPLERESQLIKAVNNKGETAVHKAAMYGQQHMFSFLVDKGETARYRKKNGSNVLHCAIIGNNPELALHIATSFPELILCRGEAGLTPLQLIVSIPSFLHSSLVRNPLTGFLYSPLNRFLYGLVPVKRGLQAKNTRADEEAAGSVDRDSDEESYGWTWLKIARRLRYGAVTILKRIHRTVNDLAKEKERYMAAMKLIEYLARETSFDFYGKGYSREPNPTVFDAMRGHSDLQRARRDDILKYILNEADRLPSKWMESLPITAADRLPNRWMESPLIIAAELGHDDFVRKILEVCPQSAIYLDSKGRNVIQVAIQSGHEKVVRVISEMLQRNNPILPSCLPSMLDNKTRNTIFHVAAENFPTEARGMSQLFVALDLFKKVEAILPRELLFSRNNEGKTAHELLIERHKSVFEKSKMQLVGAGMTWAGLLITVVLASSFSIPIDRDYNSVSSVSLVLRIVANAYMFGFGCAATALVLFLTLILTPYMEHNFGLKILRQFYFAWMSFALAFGAFYLAVICNIILHIYGNKINMKILIPLIIELLLCPVYMLTLHLTIYPSAKSAARHMMT